MKRKPTIPKQIPAMAPIERPEHECVVVDLIEENVVKGAGVDAEEKEVVNVREYAGRGR